MCSDAFLKLEIQLHSHRCLKPMFLLATADVGRSKHLRF